ncbi:Eco57I restriction-modification methylase domain-containing protein [uncultured Brachyspira sp.]|uniref:DUF7149 domain-containing protein n=1 Tax=uncultured Brachyspira sp. TaxID=221953 RepID=UPI00259BADF4|nr:Eco57I restriction-modification methylase domain-containing protein [uncultured Brachyspira sp.]
MKSITKEAKELLKRRDLLKSSIFSNLSNTEELNNLSEKLEIYKNGIRKAKEDKESEEHCKNILKDFLNGAFKYNCNTKGKIDLTIKYEGNIKAIIETKNYDNKTEMIKDNDYYYKSFYQSVLYYYQSRKNINKDMTVEHIIITDFENIYLFLRSDFEYLTANKQIINFFNVKKIDTNTKDFYNSSKAILEKINREVVGYKINLFEDDAEIIFKFLSPYNICSLKTNNDFNIISNTFYREIIYMMGLEETKDKKLVLNKVDNTLIKLTMDILDEDLKGEEKFETALKLNILWINRILFLKILEAQLRVFRDDNNLHILNSDFETKKEIRKKVLKLLKEYSQYNTKLKDYNPFDMLKSYDFFDSEIMFGIDSFDIVIGNPPYVSNKEIKNKDMVNYKKLYGIQDDLYYYFYIKGIKLLEDKGILSYISSNSFLTIQSKKGLREILQNKHLLEIINTGNVFEHAEVEPAIVTLINEDINNYEFNYSDNTKEDNPVSENNSIKINVDIFINSPNSIFFTPNEFNMRLYNKFVKEASVLINQKWNLIKTSRDIEKNQSALQNYRNSLKEGDITLLGLITEGGQGLATANNGKYVGIIENTKDAERVYNQRLEKIKYFNKEYNTNYDISKMKEKEIRELFDLLKENYGKNTFGQGFIYRIVSKNEIADINNLSKDEKENGIENKKSFVPYDKGDKEGNKWYSPTVFAIDWNSNNVDILKKDTKARWQGYNFFFKEGFSWNNVLNPNSEYIKARYKEISINDVASMSLYSLYENTSSKYFLVLLNSYFLFYYLRIFINNTVNLQINDVRQLPIIIPNKKQLKQAEILFDRGKDIKEKRINNLISEEQEQKELKKLQEEVDGFVCELYGI